MVMEGSRPDGYSLSGLMEAVMRRHAEVSTSTQENKEAHLQQQYGCLLAKVAARRLSFRLCKLSGPEMQGAGQEESQEMQGAAAASTAAATCVKPAWALLEEAAQMKTEGNAFYREKNIRSAIGRYHCALLVLRGLDSEVMSSLKGFGPERPALTSEQEASLRNTQVDCYNNLAACLLQKQNVDFNRVQEYCLRVLQWRPGDVKALYRAGVATLELGDAVTAKQYLIQACKVQPNDVNVRKHLQRAEERLNRELQKERAMYRGMFPSSKKCNSGEEINHTQTTGEGV